MKLLNSTTYWFAEPSATLATWADATLPATYCTEPRYAYYGWWQPWMWKYPQLQAHGSGHALNLLYGDVHVDMMRRN